MHGQAVERIVTGVVVLGIAASLSGGTLTASTETVQFNRDVRPILSDNCFHCHGPDKQRSGLRLDDRDEALEKWAIVPGEPSESEVVARITSRDPEYHMPPPDANRVLTDSDIDTLTRWIAEGATYEKHWAFVPVPTDIEPPDVPDITDNPIDAFVRKRLHEEGIAPSKPASREQLLRRVTFDLVGRPPSVAEIDAFLADTSNDAYKRVVNRLLASPEFGERMAVDWLDLARYADTYGYQNDRPNRVWPYRDWVIRAFNDNLPYDDFVRWQLAGDLLPNPTQDQMLATTFNRLHRQTNEGGSINEEFLVEYAADRTHTFSTAFMGITMECARCHDHKFDPISHAEYYELFAFFGNIDESGMYSHFTDATPTPSMFLYEKRQGSEHANLKRLIDESEARLATARTEAKERFEAWVKDFNGEIAPPAPIAHAPLDEISDGKTPIVGAGEVAASVSGSPESMDGVQGSALKFSGENFVSITGKVNFERTDPFTLAFWMRAANTIDRQVIIHHSKASMDAASRGYEVFLENGRLVASLNHFWPGNAIRVRTAAEIMPHRWAHATVTYDGSSRAAGLSIFLDGVRQETETIRDNLYQTIRYENEADLPLILAARFRDPGFKNGALDDIRIYDTALSAPEVSQVARQAESTPDRDALFAYYLARIDGPYQAAVRDAHEARKAESDFVETLRSIMVMQEMPQPARAHRLARGAYDDPREELSPDTPDAILAFPEDYPRNRLGLAEWLLRRDHPLTSRVAVNRMWKLFFGRGLVDTPEDFGNQGALPSHPELLDYLAGRFMESDWDVKAVCRLIVTSATYRQDSAPRSELKTKDPENRLLARGPRHRLSAEAVRDAALFASGLLVEQQGGPSVKPYQPDGLWREVSHESYSPDTGDALYRRSLYTFVKRTAPPPAMVTFDATNREVCVARRETTTTPLQALVLLNDPQFVEAARVLAARVVSKHEHNPVAAIEEAFRRLTGRAPRAGEREILMAAYDEQRNAFRTNPAEAEQYVSVGESPVTYNIDTTDLAAVTAIVQMIMNFDEFQVTR